MQPRMPGHCGPPRPPGRNGGFSGPQAVPQIQSRLPGPSAAIRGGLCVPTAGGGAEGGFGTPGGGTGFTGPDGTVFKLGIDPNELAEAVKIALANGAIFRTRPSPIDAIPYRGIVRPIFARAVIGPPTTPGDADGAAGAASMANAENAFTGQTVPVLTPANVVTHVTVATYKVPDGQAYVLKGVGVWGHDLRAQRDAIRWRVLAKGRTVSDDRELGMIGSLSSPTLVYAVLREGDVLTIEARNLDPLAGSLVEAYGFGWEFPVAGNEDTLAAITDPRG